MCWSFCGFVLFRVNYDLLMTDSVEMKKLHLGEMLNGDRFVSTTFNFEFLVDKHSEVLCKKRLSKTDVSRFRSAIDKDYYIEYYYDDLPVWAYIGVVVRDYTYEKMKNKYILYTRYDFNFSYNNNHIIGATIIMHPSFPNSVIDITKDVEVEVEFTYNVKWSATNKPFEQRMDAYMSLDRHSFTNLSLTLLVLIVCLLTLYMKVIGKDIYMYENISQDVEENPEE